MTVEQELKLLRELDQLHTWPDIYMFKFIIPADQQKYDKLTACFPENSGITKKESRKGNYWSVTISKMINRSQDVVSLYKKVGEIEGLISL